MWMPLTLPEICHSPMTDSLEKSLGVTFHDKSLLRLALTHSSLINELPGTTSESNERLEFLGDAVLGMSVAEELYSRFPDQQEGALTSMRASIVQGETLARAARRLDLGSHLLMGTGETGTGGRNRDSNLAATFERLSERYFSTRTTKRHEYSASAFLMKKSSPQDLLPTRNIQSPRCKNLCREGNFQLRSTALQMRRAKLTPPHSPPK